MTKHSRLVRILGLGLAPLWLAMVACAPAASPPTSKPGGSAAAPAAQAPAQDAAPTDRLQALINAARQEGELTLVWGENSIGGRRAIERWTDALNQQYGLRLNVQFTPGPSIPEMTAKVIQERQAGRRASTDLILQTEGYIPALMQANAVEVVDWAAWAPNIQNPELIAPGGVAVKLNSELPGITYNAGKLTGDAAPKSMQDLLKPQYKGRIASTPFVALFDRLASPELWGEERTTDYVTRLADQVAGLIRPGELERLASGEFDIFAINTNISDAQIWKTRGAPIAQVIPSDAALLQYKYLAIPAHAPHPNAAKLFVNYVLGREGQDILWETGFTDLHLIPGSKTAAPISEVRGSGVNFVEVDVAFVLRNDEKEQARIQAKLQQIMQKR